jgi:hypothetical protein
VERSVAMPDLYNCASAGCVSLRWWFVAEEGVKVLAKYHSGDQIKKNEIGGACGTYGGHERCIQGFGGET